MDELTENPKAYISYSWIDKQHKEWVLDLATRLRDDGVDVINKMGDLVCNFLWVMDRNLN